MTKPKQTPEEQCEAMVQLLKERRAMVPKVDTPEAAQWATDEAKAVKAQRQAIEAMLDPVVKAAHVAHKAAVAQRDRFTKPLKDLERAYVREAAAFDARRKEEARKALEAATEPSQVVEAVALAAPAPEGLQVRKSPPKWEVTDMLALVQAVARGDVPIEVLEVQRGAMGRLVRANAKREGGPHTLPGVRVWTEQVGALR